MYRHAILRETRLATLEAGLKSPLGRRRSEAVNLTHSRITFTFTLPHLAITLSPAERVIKGGAQEGKAS